MSSAPMTAPAWLVEKRDELTARIKRAGLDGGDLIVADIWQMVWLAEQYAARIETLEAWKDAPTIVPKLVERVQWAVRQINYALTDTRIEGAAAAWLRTIREGLTNSGGDLPPVVPLPEPPRTLAEALGMTAEQEADRRTKLAREFDRIRAVGQEATE